MTSTDAAIRELMRNLPEGIADGLNQQLAAQRLEQVLGRELEASELAFAAELDGAVVIISLEEKAAALYRVEPPLTLSRELLHLRGAMVRHQVDIADENPVRLSLELRNGASFKLRVRERDHPTQIRDELEKRATAAMER